jgi:cytochrome c-type biogenesis protein CcmH
MRAVVRRGRIAGALAVATAVTLLAGLLYAQSTERAKQIGANLVCMCGCAQILTACNHVGCTMSATMLKQLDERVAVNSSDDLLLQSFVQEYGPKVLASPPTQGFNLLAWIIPGLAFAMGLAVVLAVIRQWRRRFELAPAGGPPISSEALERARRQADRETED